MTSIDMPRPCGIPLAVFAVVLLGGALLGGWIRSLEVGPESMQRLEIGKDFSLNRA